LVFHVSTCCLKLNFMLMPFPTTVHIVPRRTDGLQEFVQETTTPQRPVHYLPKKNCLSPTHGLLPAGHHAPTLPFRPGAAGQRPTTAVDVGKGSPVGFGAPSPDMTTGVACHGKGTGEMVKTRVAPPPPPSFYYYCPPEKVSPICPVTARPPRTQGKKRGSEPVVEGHKHQGRVNGGNTDHGWVSGGGFGIVRQSRQRGGGLFVHNLLVGMLLVVVWGLGGVKGFDKLPNGDGLSSTTNAGTIRKVVSDWIAGGASKSTVIAKYGPIEDWDVSAVTNLAYVFYGTDLASTFGSFNADLSKWNTSAVTTMTSSKCTLSGQPSLWCI
jgi:surface protein